MGVSGMGGKREGGRKVDAVRGDKMEQLLEQLGWLLVEGMLASLVMVLVVVRVARTHGRKGA